MRRLGSITDSVGMNLSKFQEIVEDRGAWCAAVHGVAESDMTLGLSNNKDYARGFPDSSLGKESACNTGDPGLIPGLGRYPGGEHGNPFQYSCLENPRDRGTWQAIGHRFAKSQTQLKQLSTQHVVVQLLSCV